MDNRDFLQYAIYAAMICPFIYIVIMLNSQEFGITQRQLGRYAFTGAIVAAGVLLFAYMKHFTS
jgi:hypothetical protein